MQSDDGSHQSPSSQSHSCHAHSSAVDYLLWLSLSLILVGYVISFWWPHEGEHVGHLATFTHALRTLVNTMWWGVVFGCVMVSLLGAVPRPFVMKLLGQGQGLSPILRATACGVLLDLCSHGILMVGAKLYERGASLGQLMAFLIASPWNSFSLTLILISLIGIGWTVLFVALSMLIAVVTGLICEHLVDRQVLPPNPHYEKVMTDFNFWAQAREGLRTTRFDAAFFKATFVRGLQDSRMVLRWVFVGILLASTIQTFVPTTIFSEWFGPSLFGLAMTLLAATVIEVCSEGGTPIAADLLTRAGAPGNSFTFLMAGVSTDYTELMVLKETTRSWRITCALPLVTLPQILLVAWLMNSL